uniref:CSON013243 protein n=1 Tax=Culicoides sonorensis TaxID=179676 RepID=A0A336MBQ6_CULSO
TSVVKVAGYPIEKHRIKTTDSFKLRLHRIPSKYESSNSNKTVLLVHGILCSSSMWVANLPGNETALAFMLSDAGYDVWMLNVRGTTPSLKNEKINANNQKYWEFSWHEMGMEDIPKAIMFKTIIIMVTSSVVINLILTTRITAGDIT